MHVLSHVDDEGGAFVRRRDLSVGGTIRDQAMRSPCMAASIGTGVPGLRSPTTTRSSAFTASRALGSIPASRKVGRHPSREHSRSSVSASLASSHSPRTAAGSGEPRFTEEYVSAITKTGVR